MKQIPIKLGPLSLLLAVISICLTTLAILTLTTARADRTLAEKYAATVSSRYELEVRGQEFLRDLDEAVRDNDPGFFEDLERARNTWWESIEGEDARLRIGVSVDGGDWSVVGWRIEKDWEEDDSIGNLWQGF